MIEEIFKTSRAINNNRNRQSVLAYLMEEVGELSTEVNIKEGYSEKPEGKDGILGEAVDVILCAADLIYIDNPEVTEEEILNVVQKKLAKWRGKFEKK